MSEQARTRPPPPPRTLDDFVEGAVHPALCDFAIALLVKLHLNLVAVLLAHHGADPVRVDGALDVHVVAMLQPLCARTALVSTDSGAGR
jgi:hypothetical protein